MIFVVCLFFGDRCLWVVVVGWVIVVLMLFRLVVIEIMWVVLIKCYVFFCLFLSWNESIFLNFDCWCFVSLCWGWFFSLV